MYNELRTLLYEAETKYLQKPELENFQNCISSLKARLATYECIRDQEIAIFQPIADELMASFADENTQLLEQALKHWLSVLRYCAMAMLLNNPDFLHHRLLEWLTPVVQAHKMEVLEKSIYDLLIKKLKKILTESQFLLIKPFIEQAQTSLLESKLINKV